MTFHQNNPGYHQITTPKVQFAKNFGQYYMRTINRRELIKIAPISISSFPHFIWRNRCKEGETRPRSDLTSVTPRETKENWPRPQQDQHALLFFSFPQNKHDENNQFCKKKNRKKKKKVYKTNDLQFLAINHNYRQQYKILSRINCRTMSGRADCRLTQRDELERSHSFALEITGYLHPELVLRCPYPIHLSVHPYVSPPPALFRLSPLSHEASRTPEIIKSLTVKTFPK